MASKVIENKPARVVTSRKAKWVVASGQVYKVGDEFTEPAPAGYAKHNPPRIVSIAVAVSTGITPVVMIGILMSDNSEHYLSSSSYTYELADGEVL